MTIDELRERLHSCEPLYYDHDPFDPAGRYLPKSQKHRRPFRGDLYRSDSPGIYTSSDLDGPTSQPYLHPLCSCITLQGSSTCRKPYTHRLQNTINKYSRPSDSVLFDDEYGNDLRPLMDDHPTSGYSSEDEGLFSTPRFTPGSPLSRRRSTSALQPRPILRRVNSHTRPLQKPESI